jgi:uncharacterized protein YeaO (DUF488 family)
MLQRRAAPLVRHDEEHWLEFRQRYRLELNQNMEPAAITEAAASVT